MRETTKKSLIPSIWYCAKAFACICGIMAFMTRVIGVEAEALKWHISTTEDWQALIADTEGVTIAENHAVAEKPEVSFTSQLKTFYLKCRPKNNFCYRRSSPNQEGYSRI